MDSGRFTEKVPDREVKFTAPTLTTNPHCDVKLQCPAAGHSHRKTQVHGAGV